MKLTWFGTATILLEADGQRLLFDPFTQLPGGANLTPASTYAAEDTIFLTHGHFDHLYTAAELLDIGDPTIYCSKTPANSLEAFSEDAGSRIVLIAPGSKLSFGDVTVRALQGRHIVFDRRLILSTIRPLHFLRHARNAVFLAWVNRHCPENGETLVYEIHAEGKTILLLGSLGLDPNTIYPTGADLLVLPMQGRSDLAAAAEEVIEVLRPKRIVLSHFDDAYPPITRDVNLRPFGQMMRQKYPGIRIVKPVAGKSILL